MFDLGGVIMDIEKERCVAAFDRLGLRDAASFFGEYSQKGPFLRLEEGTMTVDDFHQAMLPTPRLTALSVSFLSAYLPDDWLICGGFANVMRSIF